MRHLALFLLSVTYGPVLAQSSFGAAFESGAQQDPGGSFSLEDIAASRQTRKPANIQTTGKACSNGFIGMVTVPASQRYLLPDPPPGQARGVIVQYVYRQVFGDTELIWYRYELQVKMAPHQQDVGKDAAVVIVASDDTGMSVIKPDGTPSYTRIYRHRANTWSEFAQPAYREGLRPMYFFTYDFGESLPANAGAIHIGYGLVSEEARQETARRSQATKTMLPAVLDGLKREQDRARERPEEAAMALDRTCRARSNPGADSGTTALTGEEAILFETNQQGMQAFCSGATGPMAVICQIANTQQSRANALAATKADAIKATRTKASGGNAGKRKPDPEMDNICERRDFDGWIARRARDAEMQAKDIENMARAGVWDLRSAIDDAAARGLCWKVIEWQGH